jgi:hypothetical protein
MQRAVHENAGRVDNGDQRSKREERRTDEPTFIIGGNEVQQRRGNCSDVNGKMQPTLRN